MSAPLRAAILTVSDRSYQGRRPDASGPALQAALAKAGWQVASLEVLPDEQAEIEAYLRRTADSAQVDLILTTGGTGVAPRDITPEATRAVIERPVPGLSEAIRAESMRITPHAMLSRGESGIRGRTLIINLSGSPRAAIEQFEVVLPALPHAVELLREAPGSEAGHHIP